MKLVFYGHSSLAIELGGKHLLIDPFISPNEKASAIDVDALAADFVLLTHGHADHVADAATILQRTGAKLISNYEIVSWFQQQGIENAHPLNHGGSVELDGITIKYVNAVHSSVLPDGTYGGNPGGFVIESAGESCYISGDTALHTDMKILGEFHRLDWAALCIGDNFTMGIKDAVIAAQWVGVKRVVGTHYDTFPPIEIDHDLALKAFADKGIELLLPAIGEQIEL